jgi:hypothetical protein
LLIVILDYSANRSSGRRRFALTLKAAPRGAGLLLALLVVIGSTVSVSLGTQQSALAAGCDPTGNAMSGYYFPVATCYTYQVAHLCEVIGTLPANGNQAVVCTDIYTAWSTNEDPETFDIWGDGEYYCQGPSEQCKGMNVKNTLDVSAGTVAIGDGNPSESESSPTYTCSTTSCPNGAREKVATTHYMGAGPAFPPLGAQQPPCFVVTATVPQGDAILVNGTTTAYHPTFDFPVSAKLCYDLPPVSG